MSKDVFDRNPALVRLDVLVGKWAVSASVPLLGASPIEGFYQFKWLLGGYFLEQCSEVTHPDAPDGKAIIGLDAEGTGYTQHYFDSRGVVRIYAMTLEGGIWTLLRETPDFSELDFSQRYTGTFSDDQQKISGAWETSRGGEPWTNDFDLTLTKVS
jgi:hypothetical protein